MFIREHTNPVYYPRCKFVYRYYLGQIRKTKIYGHWFHRNKNFYVLEVHNSILRGKKRKVWSSVVPSHYDKDVQFLIEIAINDKQKKLKKEISKLEDWIKDVPEMVKKKQEQITAMTKAIKLVSKEKFGWSSHCVQDQLNGTRDVKPIDLEHEVDIKSFM